MNLYGRAWSRRDLAARVGRLEQIGGLRRLVLSEGPEAGVAVVEARTGAGLAFTVVPSRGLDLARAEFGGVPLSWQSANGEVHPAAFDDQGLGWLRSAVGGLLMTCGLSSAGAPGQDQGQAYGLHGRAHHLPARHVAVEGAWEDDAYVMRVAGTLTETAIFGEHLVLRREISSRLGQNRIVIRDEVENAGFDPAPHMILYHFNFGFPLLDEDTRVSWPGGALRPRDAGIPLAGHDRWSAPQAGFQERVYYHDELGDAPVAVHIHNPRFPLPGGPVPLTVSLSWSPAQLPRLVQWHMPGAGTHVLGVEPANCRVEGRAAERASGTLVTLEPGERRIYELALEVSVG